MAAVTGLGRPGLYLLKGLGTSGIESPVPGLGAYSGLSAHEALCRRIEFDGGVRIDSETPELVRLVTGGADAQETLSVLHEAGATSGEIVGAALELVSLEGFVTERENALILFAELFVSG